MSRIGRPSAYTPEIGILICDQIAAGATLVAVCAKRGMPTVSTVLRWPDAAFRELYTRAKEIRLEVMAEEIKQISDTCRKGQKIERKHIGWECPKCERSSNYQGKKWVHSMDGSDICEGVKKPREVTEDKTVTADMVDRARLQVDSRKWLLARLASKTYGDRIATEVSAPGGGAIQLVVVQAGAQEPDAD